MKVFLSWSGELSHQVATTLSKWIGQTIQAIDPWISSEMEKGLRWTPEIALRLRESQVAIICLTPDNLSSPWLLFESGAISNIEGSHVCTFLINIEPANVQFSLAQFQHTSIDQNSVFGLLSTINDKLARSGNRAIDAHTLKEIFDANWPRLDNELRRAIKNSKPSKPEFRNEIDLLRELLVTVRRLEARQNQSLDALVAGLSASNSGQADGQWRAESDQKTHTPSVWRTASQKTHPPMQAASPNSLEEIEIPGFLRKQPD